MKKLLFNIFPLLISMNCLGQGWHATNLTSVIYFPVVMEVHQDKLYGTVFNAYTASLNRLNADNTSWTTIATGSDITVPRFLKSAGSRLYITTVISGVYSMLYYTTDGGSTYVPDTVGLPHAYGGVALISAIQYHKGKVIVAMSGSGYFLKDTGTTAWHSINCPTAFNAPYDPLTFYKDTLYAYDNTGANTFYVSTDFGTTWTVRTSNLPTDFGTNLLAADEVSGRLYAAGTWSNSTQYGLKYSDDGGRSWATASNVSSFLSKNASGTQQLIKAIYAHDPMVYMALENNKDASAPDIIGSVSGLANMAYDTTGLPTNAAGGVNGTGFLMYQNKLTLSLNVIDVYLKDVANGVNDIKTAGHNFTVFPNPCTNRLVIQSANGTQVTEIRITDALGKTVWQAAGNVRDADLSALRSGFYFVEFVTDGMVTEVQRIVKQ